MKLPLSKVEKSHISLKLNKSLKMARNVYLITFFGFILSIVLMQTVFAKYTAEENSDKILAPVALVLGENSTGTAFLSGPNTLITAGHVVEDLNIGDEILVSFENLNPKVETIAKLVWINESENYDPTKDFAILKLKDFTALPDDMPTLVLGSAYDMEIGSEVKAIGYPSGLLSVTPGTISNNIVKVNDEKMDLLQLNVDIWPGNSGGPIIDVNNETVVGIAISGMQDEYQGINFGAYIDFIIDELEATDIDLYE